MQAVPSSAPKSTTKNSGRKILQKLWEQKYLYLLLLPALIWVIIICYAPMYGLYMAFINYTPTKEPFVKALMHSKFVGLQWFKYFVSSSDFYIVMRNTLAMSLLTLIMSFPAPIILALALNEVKGTFTKKFVQTASYLPYFISWVIAANIFITLLSADGVINHLLKTLHLTNNSILFFQKGQYFWWIIAFANTWKVMGYNSIIYLAAIAGISQEQYEAAKVDGANRIQQIIHITLPALKPTIIMLMILAIGNILNAGFEQQLLMQNNSIMDYSDVLDTYVYRYGLQNGALSYAAAVGLFKSVISLILLVFANFTAKKLNDQSLF
ncbi:ABC transporter permease [Clostridium oryzae]|uniref:Putative multiple-sugar transport system permease YteP n=1 Tax=Clostridium oryzae TaxID=1450648 RepID=A0A1V4IW13_9CLOT|nr:ABC transporter permease subunit [Clostridium oryzae]OPJ63985.1 putative multiple-sugar transport system permease YteP [Clostridium oryzae]